MKKLIAIAMLLVGMTAAAQTITEAPKPKFLNNQDKVTVSFLAVSIITDALSTQHMLGLPGRAQPDGIHVLVAQEGNPLARPFVGSRTGQAFESAGGFGIQLGLMYWAHRTGHERIKHLIPMVGTALETFLTVHNENIISKLNHSNLPMVPRP